MKEFIEICGQLMDIVTGLMAGCLFGFLVSATVVGMYEIISMMFN